MRLPRTSLELLLLAGTALSSAAFAQELPGGASVAAGSVSVNTSASGSMTVNQSTPTAIVNWQSFSIGEGGSVTFAQPDSQSAILNRVTGSATTSIAGHLGANGQVFIVNPNGIGITQSGTVSVGGFVASTLNITDQDFLAGNNSFAGDGSSADVSNAGRIDVVPGGYAALIGGRVDNSGTIAAPLGKIGLGAAERVTLDFSSDGFLQVALPSQDGGSDALITNSGTISANGGAVAISAAAAQDAARRVVNLGGLVEARTVSGVSGNITLGGGGGKVVVTGRIDASSAPDTVPPPIPQPRPASLGGNVTITGSAIELIGASIDASGVDGGGAVRIGGDFQGGGVLPHAGLLSVDEPSTISADATANGDGGYIILWSDLFTDFAGRINARGAGAGAGGFVEVSGKALLSYRGFSDLTAESGKLGNLLLDPYDVYIRRNPDGPLNNDGPPDFTPSGNDSQVDADLLESQLNGANVTITTGDGGLQDGDITLEANLLWTGAGVLTLDAANDIFINGNINGGGLILDADGNIAFGFSDGSITPVDVAVGEAGMSFTAGGTMTDTGGSFFSSGDATIAVGTAGGGADDFTLTGELLAQGTASISTADGDLTVNTVNGVAGVLLQATGGVTILDTVSSATEGPSGDVVIVASTFDNQGGSEGGIYTPDGRILIYLDTWTGNDPGNIEGLNLYNRTFALNGPGTIGNPGQNYFIYEAQPTITFTAPSGSRVYYEPVTGLPVPTYDTADLINGDTIAQVIGGSPVATDTSPIDAGVGTYSGAITTTGITSLIGYLIVFANGDMTVTPAPLTITANAISKTYGQARAFGLTDVTPSGLRGADSIAAITLASSGAAPSATVAGGPYTVVPSNATGTGLANYTITYVNGLLTVTPAPLTITANNRNKQEGEEVIFAGTEFVPVGLVSGDQVSTVALTSAGAPAAAASGPYAINAAGAAGTGLENYTISYVPGTLTVSAVPPPPPPPPPAPPNFAGASAFSTRGTTLDNPPDDLPGGLFAEVTTDSALLSLQVLEQRSQDFRDEIAQCELQLSQSEDSGAFIDCASDALESYGEAIDDPLIRLPPELQGTVSVIRQTVQRMRSAGTVAEARAAVGDLVDFVRAQTALVRAVEPETEALLAQHGTVMAEALETLDLALVGAVEI